MVILNPTLHVKYPLYNFFLLIINQNYSSPNIAICSISKIMNILKRTRWNFPLPCNYVNRHVIVNCINYCLEVCINLLVFCQLCFLSLWQCHEVQLMSLDHIEKALSQSWLFSLNGGLLNKEKKLNYNSKEWLTMIMQFSSFNVWSCPYRVIFTSLSMNFNHWT